MSKRWYRLAHTAPLLQALSVEVRGVAGALAWRTWLGKHVGKVQELGVVVRRGGAAPTSAASAAAAPSTSAAGSSTAAAATAGESDAQVAFQLARCFSALAAGPLIRLHLRSCLPPGSWFQPPPRLQRLWVDFEGGGRSGIGGGWLQSLAALESLTVWRCPGLNLQPVGQLLLLLLPLLLVPPLLPSSLLFESAYGPSPTLPSHYTPSACSWRAQSASGTWPSAAAWRGRILGTAPMPGPLLWKRPLGACLPCDTWSWQTAACPPACRRSTACSCSGAGRRSSAGCWPLAVSVHCCALMVGHCYLLCHAHLPCLFLAPPPLPPWPHTPAPCRSLERVTLAGRPLAAALSCLTQLTCLVLDSCTRQPPAELASLARLQRLLFTSSGGGGGEGAGEDAGALPEGRWARSLRWLAAEWPVLAASRECLEGTSGLQAIHIISAPGEGMSLTTAHLRQFGWAWFKGWAKGRKALRHLTYDCEDPGAEAEAERPVRDTLAALAAGKRSQLVVEARSDYDTLSEMTAEGWRAHAAWGGGT